MHRLLRLLLRPDIALWRYCLYAWPLAIIPSVCFVLAARFTVEAFGRNASAYSAPARDVTLGSVFGGVVFAPVVETLLLAGLLRLLSFISLTPALVAAVSAVLWGCFHALFGALWFFGSAWSFFVLSCGFLAWRPISFKHGFLAAAVPHVLVNSTAYLVIWAA